MANIHEIHLNDILAKEEESENKQNICLYAQNMCILF